MSILFFNRYLKNSKGLVGKKGILWWSIHRILCEKPNKPNYLLLENVDRLLKSPAKQRGRDFAIILQSLNELDYAVEWKVINAAEYGMPQRRRRVFIFACHKDSPLYEKYQVNNPEDLILSKGIFANQFPLRNEAKSLFPNEFDLKNDLVEISENFNINGKLSPFYNSGIMLKGKVSTIKTYPDFHGKSIKLNDIIQSGEVTSEFIIDPKDLERWKYLKGAKKETRKNAQGFEYQYSEGGMIFPDDLNKPSRTIITGEGGKSPSRFKHVIETPQGLRRLTPIELERLNMFPDDHTKLEGISNTKRAFFMGNALVVGIIEKLGKALYHQLKLEECRTKNKQLG